MLEKLGITLPSVLTAMILSASFTVWALGFFDSKEAAQEHIGAIEKRLDEYHLDIKQIKSDLDFIKGQLSKK